MIQSKWKDKQINIFSLEYEKKRNYNLRENKIFLILNLSIRILFFGVDELLWFAELLAIPIWCHFDFGFIVRLDTFDNFDFLEIKYMHYFHVLNYVEWV